MAKMQDIIDRDFGYNKGARKKMTLIMDCFEDPQTSYDTVKKIYNLCPEFIRFCYKSLNTDYGFKIKRHKYGFSNTPHVQWREFETKNDTKRDKDFYRAMIFELGFRMLQQVFNSFPLDNTYEYIKHANTVLSRCRVCELLWQNNEELIRDLQFVKSFFLWFIGKYNGIEIHYELYDYCYNTNEILTIIYYYNTIYALKYDYVAETDALISYDKLIDINKRSFIFDDKTLDQLINDIHIKYKFVSKPTTSISRPSTSTGF